MRENTEKTYLDACRKTCRLGCGEEDAPDAPECRMLEYFLLELRQLFFSGVSTDTRDEAENALTYLMNFFEIVTRREKNNA